MIILTDIPTMIDNFLKIIQKQLEPVPEVNIDIEDEIDEEIDSFGIPQTKVAVFWDYENFQLPSQINETLFFEYLFSSGSEERIISKRVYSKPDIIEKRLEVIKNHNFEFKQGLLSRKSNEVDHILITDCVQFCSKSSEPLLVVLMAGDADYLSLIETLTKDGHEVRLICKNSKMISQSLKAIVPVIIDREKIENGILQLRKNLYSFSSLTNYLLSIGNNNSLEIDALIEEVQKYYISNLNKQISTLFKLLQNSPDYNWQYTFSNKIIQRNDIVISQGPKDTVPNRVIAHIQGLLFKLGYEEDYDEWIKFWHDYCIFETSISKRMETLHDIYKISPIPSVHNHIQKELVNMLLYQQSNSKAPQNSRQVPKNFSCNQCGKKFARKPSLNQHIRASHRNQ